MSLIRKICRKYLQALYTVREMDANGQNYFSVSLLQVKLDQRQCSIRKTNGKTISAETQFIALTTTAAALNRFTVANAK